jgi:hypothetical protein
LKRARRRRFLARRIAGVLGYVQPVSPVEAGTLAEPPGSLPQDMGKVWAAAVAGDPSPDLATHGKTGTVGAGSRSLSTGDPYLEGTDALPAFRRIVRQEQLFPVIWTIDHFEHSDRKFVSVNELLTNKYLEP